MCQCGCGDTVIERAFKIERGPTIGYQLYSGCADCHSGIAALLMLFDRKGVAEWVRCEIEKAPAADEYGGNRGHGIVLPIFEVRDLIAAAQELEPIGRRKGEYSSLPDWLADFGLQLIQGAIRKARTRTENKETT